MGHYPIKCIRCAHIMSNEDVKFNTRDVIIGMSDIMGQSNKNSVAAETKSTPKRGIWDQDPAEENTPPTKKKSIWDEDDDTDTASDEKKAVTTLYDRMTFSELAQFCNNSGFEPCQLKWQKVTVTNDFKDDSDEDLLIGINFQKEKDGPMVYTNRRYCPICGCELPMLSGSMPTFNVTLMGTSSSGKTVYLCALNWLLSQGQGTLPLCGNLSCVSANNANNDLVQRSTELFRQGVLPGTTQIVLTEPLSFQMTFQIGGKIKKCLLSIADMRGEDFLDIGGVNLMTRGKYFSSADAFMFLVSPLDMPYISNIIPEDSNPGEGNVHQVMMSNINQYILPNFNDGQVAAPCTIMLSKCDVLKKNISRLNIPYSNAVVAPEIPPALRFTKDYFLNQDAGTRWIANCDSPLYSFIQTVFRRSYFTSFSSLGSNVNIIEDDNGNQRVENPNLLRPIRVVDPIIYLLISLGFLPKYHMMVAGDKARKQNEAIIIEWMKEHL